MQEQKSKCQFKFYHESFQDLVCIVQGNGFKFELKQKMLNKNAVFKKNIALKCIFYMKLVNALLFCV